MGVLWRLSTCAIALSLVDAVLASNCKCVPNDSCWPSQVDWDALNTTLSGALIQSTPPGTPCYPSHPSYSEAQCAIVRQQWFNSTWHAQNPISIDYPIWANNSCNPIWPNGTSLTGDAEAGKKGCSIGNYPVYAVNATSAEQVRDALVWAGEKNVRVVVKATGHSYPGRSIGFGSLNIWTRNLQGIQYADAWKPTSCPLNTTLQAVRVGAGHTALEVQAELAKHNQVTVTGENSDVGLVGWITAGGHGALSTTYGMGADNLLEATIVTPLGDIVTANPCLNTDLFFAIRGGGGGTFGVVTSMVVKTFPSPRSTFHLFQLASRSTNMTSEFYDFMAYLHTQYPRLKAGGMQGYYFITGPPAYPTLAFYWAFYLFDKPSGTVGALMAPIEARLKQLDALFAYTSREVTTADFWTIWGASPFNELVATGGEAYGSWLMSPASLANISTTARVLQKIGPSAQGKNVQGVFANPTIRGHMIASPNPPSYFPALISMNPAWRRTLTHLMPVESWPDGIPQADIDAVYADITHKTQALRDLAPDMGAYMNECDSYEPKWQEAFWGEAYERLRGIKERVDPRNVLWCRRCVGSEALVEEDGRLCEADG